MPLLLKSIEAQKLPDSWELEWVVCDDGSDANQLQALKDLLSSSQLSTTLIEHQDSHGVSASRNDAVRACKGEFILDLDDDDLLTSDAVKQRVGHLIESGALWSFTNAAVINEAGEVKIGAELIENWNHNQLDSFQVIKLMLDQKAWYWASTRTYRKDTLFQDGKLIEWDPKYIVAQDLDHWIALTEAIGPPRHLNMITTYWREKQDSHGINGLRSGLQAEMFEDIRHKWTERLKDKF